MPSERASSRRPATPEVKKAEKAELLNFEPKAVVRVHKKIGRPLRMARAICHSAAALADGQACTVIGRRRSSAATAAAAAAAAAAASRWLGRRLLHLVPLEEVNDEHRRHIAHHAPTRIVELRGDGVHAPARELLLDHAVGRAPLPARILDATPSGHRWRYGMCRSPSLCTESTLTQLNGSLPPPAVGEPHDRAGVVERVEERVAEPGGQRRRRADECRCEGRPRRGVLGGGLAIEQSRAASSESPRARASRSGCRSSR